MRPLRLALAGVLAATFCAAPAARADQFTELALRWFPSIRNMVHRKPHGPQPIVTIGPAVSTCSFSAAREIRREIRRHLPQLTECFQYEARYGQTELALQAALRFTIEPNGKPTAILIATDFTEDDVERCLAHEVAGWRFPASDAASRVTYPLNYQRLK
jgi:hypothetical protein